MHNGPSLLVLGGLLHMTGQQMGSSFLNLFNSLTRNERRISLYSIVTDEQTVGDLVEDMCSFSAQTIRRPGILARGITDKLILPDTLFEEMCKKDKISALKDIQDHALKINMFGFSYGTSLIQQIELCAIEKIKIFSDQHPEFSMEELSEALRGILAVSIAPVCLPNVMDNNYNTHLAAIYDSSYAETRAIFQQFIAVRQNDKIADDISGGAFHEAGEPYKVLSNQTSTIIVGQMDDSMVRRVGLKKNQIGYPAPYVNFSFDHEAHSLPLYLNVLESHQDMLTFPSSCVAPALRHAVNLMCNASVRGDKAVASLFNKVCTDMCRDKNTQAYIVAELVHLHQAFDEVVSRYLTLSFDNSVQFIEGVVRQYESYQGVYALPLEIAV